MSPPSAYCLQCGEPNHLCVCREKQERVHDALEDVHGQKEPDGTLRPGFCTATENACPKCHQTVFFNERVSGPGGYSFHRDCYRCFDCGRRVDASTACDHQSREVYCKACYGKRFGPKGFRGGSTLVRTPERSVRTTDEVKQNYNDDDDGAGGKE